MPPIAEQREFWNQVEADRFTAMQEQIDQLQSDLEATRCINGMLQSQVHKLRDRLDAMCMDYIFSACLDFDPNEAEFDV